MDGRWTRRSALSATRTSSATSPWAGASPPSEPRSPATEGSAARAPQGAAAAPGLPLARLGDRRDEALGQAERRADALAELPGDLQHLPDAAVEEGPGGGEALRPVVQPVKQRRDVDAGQQRPPGGEVVEIGRAAGRERGGQK